MDGSLTRALQPIRSNSSGRFDDEPLTVADPPIQRRQPLPIRREHRQPRPQARVERVPAVDTRSGDRDSARVGHADRFDDKVLTGVVHDQAAPRRQPRSHPDKITATVAITTTDRYLICGKDVGLRSVTWEREHVAITRTPLSRLDVRRYSAAERLRANRHLGPGQQPARREC
jgi:hypothetical protein